MEGTAVMTQEKKRSERSDRGAIRERPRDTHALTWLAQMYGAPIDVVARVLGTTRIGARDVVKRWDKAGWINRGRVDAGPEWIWPTTAVVNRLLPREDGKSWGAWGASPMLAAHTRAVAEVRLAITGRDLWSWRSEREIAAQTHGYKREGQEIGHLPDGVAYPQGAAQLVEVELRPKTVARTKKIIAQLRQQASARGSSEILYVATAGETENVVRRAVEQIASEHRQQWLDGVRVVTLDNVIGAGGA